MACIGNRISGEKTKKLVSVCLTSFFLGCLAAYSQKKTLPFGDVSFGVPGRTRTVDIQNHNLTL